MRLRLILMITSLGLLWAGCPGSTGELGEEHFVYSCVGEGDPYCDAELYDDYCYGTCVRPFSAHPDQEIPDAIALGARFMVEADPGGVSSITPQSVSPSIVDWVGGAFEAVDVGEVALLAFEERYAKDYVYVTIVAPDRIRVDEIDEEGNERRNISHIELGTGMSVWLRVTPVDIGGRVLHGALPCEWTLDSTALAFDTSPNDNLVLVTADATDATTVDVAVDLGSFSGGVSVSVLDASALAGGAP